MSKRPMRSVARSSCLCDSREVCANASTAYVNHDRACHVKDNQRYWRRSCEPHGPESAHGNVCGHDQRVAPVPGARLHPRGRVQQRRGPPVARAHTVHALAPARNAEGFDEGTGTLVPSRRRPNGSPPWHPHAPLSAPGPGTQLILESATHGAQYNAPSFDVPACCKMHPRWASEASPTVGCGTDRMCRCQEQGAPRCRSCRSRRTGP